MTLMLAGKKIAILVANGFDENQMSDIQRALIKVKADIRTISPEQGVVNGWQGEGWGHHFPVNVPIGEALGSDFDILVLPGGSRGVARLKTNLHARRIINHFIAAEKPVAAIGEGVSLLALSSLRDRIVAAPVETHDELEAAGAGISDETQMTYGHLLTADGSDTAGWVEAALAFFDDSGITRVAA
jgi:protease I